MITTSTMMITGASDGIGLQTAMQLGLSGATLLVHARTETKAHHAVAALHDAGVKGAKPAWGDLSSLAEVRQLAAQVKAHTSALDVLVNNAGVFMNEDRRTADGFEMTFGVNHFAHHLLTHLVLPLLEAAPAGRVVNVSSVAHSRGRVALEDLPVPRHFEGYGAYGASKLLNVLFTHELARRLTAKGSRVVTFALHPGVITTKLLKTGFSMAGASVESGARTSVFCATSKNVGASGTYYSDARETPCAPHANDPVLEKAVYEKSCALVGCAPLEPIRL